MLHHAKSDSEVTSLAPSSPPRSPRRPVYYVMSPSQHDGEKLSTGWSPAGSPLHHHHHHPHPQHHRYGSSPIHHSRESSTARYSASLKNGPWMKMSHGRVADGDDEDEDDDDGLSAAVGYPKWCYGVWFVTGFVVLFSIFSLILWGASKTYKPNVSVKSLVFESFNIQAGMDQTGVPTKMMSIKSRVKILYRNPATFFGVHVSSTPLDLYYYDLKIASGKMGEFYQRRKSQRVVMATVGGSEVPLYGGGSGFSSRSEGGVPANVPLNLTFVVRSRANVLGKLVKSKFYRRIRCSFYLKEAHIGKPIDFGEGCEYHD